MTLKAMGTGACILLAICWIQAETKQLDDPCGTDEFQCTSGDQCVLLAYQCNQEIDCLDKSDEIGCYPIEAPGTDALPTQLAVVPKLIYHQEPFTNRNGKKDILNIPELEFRCNFTEAADNYYYYSYWYINENYILSKGPSKSKDDLSMFEKEILNNSYGLGIRIQCRIRVAQSIDGLLTKEVSSDGFFAGIKVITRRISMKQNETGTVVFEPTVPLGCQYLESKVSKSDSFCYHDIQMINPNETDEYSCEKSILKMQSPNWCGTPIKGSLRTEADNWEAKRYSLIVETTTASYNEEILFTMILMTNDVGPSLHRIWQNYIIDYIRVVVDNDLWKYPQCYARCHPYMKSADGWTYKHENLDGEFLLYRNKKYAIERRTHYVVAVLFL